MLKDSYAYPILILFRHGQTDFNAQRRFQGQFNVPLNEKGLLQVKETGEHVSRILQDLIGNNSSHNLVIECLTSDLKRAKDTACVVSETVKDRLNIELTFYDTPLLREYHAGSLANYTLHEYNELHPGVMEKYFEQYTKDPWNSCYPGEEAESWHMVSRRISGLLKKINALFVLHNKNNPTWETVTQGSPKNVFIWSTHGGIMANFLQLMSVKSNLGVWSLGNGDVLALAPIADYRQIILSNLQESYIPAEGSSLPISQVIEHECYVSWKVIRHMKVGDAVTAKSDLDIHQIK